VAHSLSAKKRVRQNVRRRARTRARRSELKTRVRRYREALTGTNLEAAEQAFRNACKVLDREADRGLIHRNAAARRKSKLARHLNALKGQAVG
jgi:small subunit ribosomal protein S20